MRLFLFCLLILLPQSLWAACSGTDLRDSLSAAQKAVLAKAEAETPFSTGNRWRATRDDRVIDLIGTIHISDPRLDPVVTRFAPAIETADLLFLEAIAEDRKALERNLATDSSLLLLQNTTLPELLAEDDWQTLADAAKERGIPAFMAAKMQPWYLSLVLAMPSCAMEVMTKGKGLDARIEALATEAGVARRSLEPYDTVFRVFNAEPLDEQLQMLQISVSPEDLGGDLMASTLNSYFEESHSDSWQLARMVSLGHIDLPEAEVEAMQDKMEKGLLIDRNLAWIDVIEDAPESNIAVAVGAAHLMGETGLLNQLEQRGYTLERLPF